MLNSSAEVINGTILAKELNQIELSFLVPPEIKEMLLSFRVIAINCAGRSFSEPVKIGKVFNYMYLTKQIEHLINIYCCIT